MYQVILITNLLKIAYIDFLRFNNFIQCCGILWEVKKVCKNGGIEVPGWLMFCRELHGIKKRENELMLQRLLHRNKNCNLISRNVITFLCCTSRFPLERKVIIKIVGINFISVLQVSFCYLNDIFFEFSLTEPAMPVGSCFAENYMESRKMKTFGKKIYKNNFR